MKGFNQITNLTKTHGKERKNSTGMSKEETKLIKATHSSDRTPLMIGDIEIPCYVLQDGTRVLSRIGFLKAIGRTGKAKGGRKYDQESQKPVFLTANNLKDLITNDLLRDSKPLYFLDKQGNEVIGYKAEILPDVLWVYSDAYDKGVLRPSQLHIGEQAKILLKAFTKTTIIALVDEATGYQYDREKYELQKILKAYISEELLQWQKRFPDEFYKEIFRLNNWEFTVKQILHGKRPGVIGNWTKKYIYSALPKGVLNALLDKTPRDTKGKLSKKLHQSLTKEQGIEHLNKQIISVVTIMNISDNWKQFERLWNKKFGQQELDFAEYSIIDPPAKKK